MSGTATPFARRLAAGLLTGLLAALPASAETPLVEITFGDASLVAGPDDIHSVNQAPDDALVPTLYIKLAARLNSRMAEITGPNVGTTGSVRICGEIVSEPFLQAQIPVANFLISDPDPAVIDRLEAQLKRRNCDPTPLS